MKIKFYLVKIITTLTLIFFLGCQEQAVLQPGSKGSNLSIDSTTFSQPNQNSSIINRATLTTNITRWYSGNTQQNILAMRDSNISTQGKNDYQVHPLNADGKNITLTWGTIYTRGSFVFYNRTNCCFYSIQHSTLEFKLNDNTVYHRTIYSKDPVITLDAPDSVAFNQVILTFAGDHQNFREIDMVIRPEFLGNTELYILDTALDISNNSLSLHSSDLKLETDSANFKITHKSIMDIAHITTNINEWYHGNTEKNLAWLRNGNTSTQGHYDYQVHPLNANGKQITMSWDSVYTHGSFLLYNRTRCCRDRIQNSRVQFLLDDVIYGNYQISSTDSVIVLEPFRLVPFNKVILIFSGDTQNFREIEVKVKTLEETAPDFKVVLDSNQLKSSGTAITLDSNQTYLQLDSTQFKVVALAPPITLKANITTNVTNWYSGHQAQNLAAVRDGNISTVGKNNYQIHPLSANGKNMTFAWNSVYRQGSFLFYNRTGSGRIQGSTVAFKLGKETVYSRTIYSRSSIITIKPPVSVEFDKVELTFSGDKQNFREIVVQGKFVRNTSSFVTRWNMPAGDFTINAQSGYTYNYTVNWGDGSVDRNVTGTKTHTYSTAGIYDISISGDFPAFRFGNSKLLEVKQWGNIEWQTMSNAFSGATNLTITAIDNPNLSQVTDMSSMFIGASSFNQPLNSWDVSNVVNMSSLFYSATSFNQPLDNWDVSNVTNMSNLFYNARSFDQDLNSWDVSRVTDMNHLFAYTVSFRGDVSNWNVSNVTNMSNTFATSVYFSSDISNWNVSKVTNMHRLFFNTLLFNVDVSGWDVSRVTDMGSMFHYSGNFNQDLSNWNVSQVRNMSNLFDLSNVSTENYDATLKSWSLLSTLQPNVNLSSTQSYSSAGQAGRDRLLSRGWIVSDNGLLESSRFITRWNLPSGSFEITVPTGYTYNYLVDWGDGSVSSNVTGSISHSYGQSGVYDIKISGQFPAFRFGDTNLLDVRQWGSTEWETLDRAFAGAVNMVMTATDAPNLSKVTNMRSAFYDASSFNTNINHWDVSNVTNMYGLFCVAVNFNQPLDNWDVSNVTSLESTFHNAIRFNQNINNWDVSNVANMDFLFGGAIVFNQPLNNWDVSNVTSMRQLLGIAYKFNQPLDNWDVSKVTNMSYMFSHGDFNQDISNWNVSNVVDMRRMFIDANTFNQNLGNWDVSGVENMSRIFYHADNFNQNLSDWNISKVTDMNEMFTNTALSTNNYDAILNGWSSRSSQSGVIFGADNVQYSSLSQYGRNILESRGWVITDGGLAETGHNFL